MCYDAIMANKRFYYRNKSKSPKEDARAAIRAEVLARYDGAQLELTVGQLGLGEDICKLLVDNKISTAADLVVRTEKDMYRVQGLNKRVLGEVKAALKAHNMSLVEDVAQRKAEDPQKTEEKSARGGKFGLADRAKPAKGEMSAPERQKLGKKQNAQQQKGAAVPMPPERPKLDKPLPEEEWHKVLKGGKWGFNDGIRTVIVPMYDEVFCFKEGLASVEKDGKCGYIDSSNNIVIPFEYDTAMSFSEGLAMVVKGDKCGYINKQNELVFPYEYDAATAFEDGEAKVKKAGKWATLSKDGTLSWI